MGIAEKLSAALIDKNQAALITSESNRRYLTGFKSSSGTVVITKERCYFLTDARYHEKAAETVTGFKVILAGRQKDGGLKEQLEHIFVKHGIETVSVENREMTIARLDKLKEMFPQYEFDSSSWLSDLLTKRRMVKTDWEIKRIETAQRIAERAFGKLLTKLRAGMTERQVAAVLNYYMLELGADDIAFPTIAASGKNSAVPHAAPTDKPLEDGDFVTIDFGAVIDGYHSDMTRTVVIGQPSETMKRAYDAVLSANNDALKAIRVDISGKVLDNVARATLEAWGYEQFFTHGLGHGVGLDIHEAPTISLESISTLKEGMVFTIEPGVYLPHKFGVRIEDMVVVTKAGCINLTKTQKTLIYI